MILLAVNISAQPTLEVSVERPSRLILEHGYTTFTINVINASSKTIDLRVIRTVNERPDDTWETSVCSPTFCYDAEVDSLDPYSVAPGQNGAAQVHLFAGESGSARIVLSLDPQDGTDPVAVELRGEVGILQEPSILATVDSTESNAFGGSTVEFGFYIFNATNDSLRIRLKRLEKFFPDDTWATTLCYFGACNDPEVDSIPVTLQTHEAALFAVKIITGNELGGEGEVEIEVAPGDGSEPTYHRFVATVTQVSGVRENERTTSQMSTFVPNPTSLGGTIILPSDFITGNAFISMTDATGRRLIHKQVLAGTNGSDPTAQIPIDLSQFPAGTYYYRIQAGEKIASGSFIVVR